MKSKDSQKSYKSYKSFANKLLAGINKINKITVILIAVLAIVVLGILLWNKPESARAAWWNDNWTYRKALVINHGQVAGDLTDFPVLVSLTDSSLSSHAQEDGDDFKFLLHDTSEVLSHEIEKYVSSTGELVAWVRIPNLSSTADTVIYMYYGNAGVGSQEDEENVWDSNYKGVWHLKENGGAGYDSTSNGEHLTETSGTIPAVASKIGNGRDFELGDTEYLTHADGGSTDISGVNQQLTLSAWVFLETVQSGNAIYAISKYDTTSARQYSLIRGGDNYPQYNIGYNNGDSYKPCTGGTAVTSTGTWFYFTGVYNDVDIRFYLDGSLDTNGVVNPLTFSEGILSETAPFAIGARFEGGSPTGYWDGLIDEVRVSNIARSPAWIETEFNNQSSPATFFAEQVEEVGPGPVGYWTFDEGYGDTAYDQSGQGNDGTITGLSWQDESMCIAGKCLYKGGSGWIQMGDVDALDGVDEFTINFWAKTNSFSAWQTYILESMDTNNRIQIQDGSSAGELWFLLGNGSNTGGYVANVYDLNEWFHVAMRYDGNGTDNPAKLKVYINGEEKFVNFSGAIPSTTPSVNNSFYAIEGFHGFMDELKIYPYARTADEIRQDYLAGLAGQNTAHGVAASFGSASDKWMTDGLVGYWKMDEPSSATTYVDSSGNGNTGTAYGNASTTGGKFGNGGVFDGTGDYVDIGDVGNGIKTVAFWLKADDVTTRKVINIDGTDQIEIDGSSNITATSFPAATVYVDGAVSSVVTTAWHYVVIIDTTGVNVSTFSIGSVSTDYYDGQIDEVRIYNHALSPAEVKKLYEWAPGPVAHWKMDEQVAGDGQTIYDSAASTTISGGNHGTTVDGANNTGMDCSKPGKYGTACEFDGADDYVNAGSESSLDDIWIGGGTVSAWVYIDEFDSDDSYYVVSKYGVSVGHDWIFWVRNTPIRPYTLQFSRDFDGGDADWISTNSISTGQWQHIAVAYDESSDSNEPVFYLNGEVLNMDIKIQPLGKAETDEANELSIGGKISDNTRSFDGRIDDVRIYNYARTQKQILEDMNGGGPAANQPVLHLSFDEGYGATAYDSSIHKNHGTLEAGGSGANSTEDAMWSLDGKYGKAMEFDGVNDYVVTGYNPIFTSSDDFTISFWYKSNDTTHSADSEFVASAKDAGGVQQVVIEIDGNASVCPDDEIVFFAYDNSVLDDYVCSGESVDNNDWHHVAGVYDVDGNMEIYIDGIKKDMAAVTDSSNGTKDFSSDPFEIGDLDGGQFFDGLIDEVKIWNYALSEDEVKTVCNRGQAAVMGSLSSPTAATSSNAASRAYCVPGSDDYCAAPVAEWRFDEKTGSTAYDKSGQGNDGTLTWMATSTNGGWRGSGQCQVGNCLEFDGVDDYVAYPTIFNNEETGVSVSAWVNSKEVNSKLLYHGDNGEIGLTLSDSVDFRIKLSNDIWYIASSSTVQTDNWFNITGVWEKNNAIKLYIDGILKDAILVPDFFLKDPGINYLPSIGTWNRGTALPYHDGLIDDVLIYNYARTPAQIAWDYNRGKPIAEWRFDECSGGTIYDQSGNASHGTLQLGAAGVTATGTCASSSDSFWYNGRSGKYSSAGSFDGTDDHVDFMNKTFSSSQAWTVSHWLRWDGYSSSGEIWVFYMGDKDTSGDALLLINNQNKQFTFRNTTSTYYPFSSNSSALYFQGDWFHSAWVADGSGNLSLYINGQLFETISAVTSISFDSIGRGYSSDSHILNGLIDEVKIWNYALTAEQVKTEYNGGAVRFGN